MPSSLNPAITAPSALDDLVRAGLARWDYPKDTSFWLHTLSENATYVIEPPTSDRVVLRVHRPGYHSRAAIESELAWMQALHAEADVITPTPIAGRDGAFIQEVDSGALGLRHLVLFRFIEGREPDPSDNLIDPLQRLGEMSAKLHDHARGWTRPAWFTRFSWNDETILGETPHWGHWSSGPKVDAVAAGLLSRAQALIRQRLKRFGRTPERYGLIHADIRLANLLIDGSSTRVIDFDDSGFGWFLYDAATTVSFHEDHPNASDWIEAWLTGYARAGQLTQDETAEIPTFVLLRRLALLGWMGTHTEVDIVRELSPTYAEGSCRLAEEYLSRFG
ncbi:MAG: phosphotransferase [Pseudomonadota bacterium]